MNVYTPEEQRRREILERRRKAAEALYQQSQQPSGTEVIGGWAVKRSPLEGVAKVLSAYAGRKMGEKADRESGEIDTQAAQRRQDELNRIAATPDREEMARMMTASQYPDIQQRGLAVATERPLAPNAAPSSVAEYEYRKSLPGGIGGEADRSFMEGKRALQFLDTGGQYTGVGTGAGGQAVNKTVAPDKQPDYLAEVERLKGDLAKAGDAGAAYKSAEYGISQMQALRNDAQELLSHSGREAGTGMSSYITGLPVIKQMTGAGDFKAKLDTLKSKTFISTLGAMREASKTGGAVGNVSNMEGQRFENALVALDQAQTDEQFASELQKLVQMTDQAIIRIRDAYMQDYGNIEGARQFDQQFGGGAPEQSVPQPAPQPAGIDDILNRYK